MTKKRIFLIILCLLVGVPAGMLGIILYDVLKETEFRIERGAIDQIISSESPVYYDDQKTQIGVFFEKTHRKHIPYQEIPKNFIKALVAAEDGDFFSHRGVDLKSILRAFISNIKSRKVVQGGSTITQQTAKNIFKREKRSYKAKLRELIQAFLLEKKYSKEEILEMYINQFFVSGYGKGLSIAAEYFFDKNAKNLDLVEAAFIAGSVKGPNRYNPFIKKNVSERNRAVRLAENRKNYVLKNMQQLNFITQKEYLEAKATQIPFKEGQITYRLNVILDYVREQLESDFFQEILKDQGVDNVASSGISIHTSINQAIQDAALTGLRTHLPAMDVKLEGYEDRQIPDSHRDLFRNSGNSSKSSLPFLARITHVDTTEDSFRMVVSWGKKGGIIYEDGLVPMARAWLKWKKGEWATYNKHHLRAFLKQFKEDDTVPVRMMQKSDGSEDIMLALTRIPELEGGVIVLQNGMIKAMVGGYLDRFFNRAIDARRQLGSIFKPLVYIAALQLKWNTMDPLINRRELFQFENTFYFPNPDHDPKSEEVSITWAGANSENLATVWLLFHLTDRLNLNEFRQLMAQLKLERADDESYLDYKKRIRDKYGVVVNMQALREAAFEKTKKGIQSDIIFSGQGWMLPNLDRLHFNLENNRIRAKTTEEENILRFSYKRLQKLNREMKNDVKKLTLALDVMAIDPDQRNLPEGSLSLRRFHRTVGTDADSRLVYTTHPEALTPIRLTPVTPQWMMNRKTSIDPGEIWIDGLLSSTIVDLMETTINDHLKILLTLKKYDPDVLFWVKDFRTLVNLKYVVYLSNQLGINTQLDPVLSFPLGPNAISICEAAKVYQTIMTGNVFPMANSKNLSMVPMITKIVDRQGEVLWEFEHHPVQKLSPRVSGLIMDILRKVMETGTGKTSGNKIKIFDIPIPTFGKTGTSNRFTNSSFVGFIPGPDKDRQGFNMEKGYVIAAYVGYDNNQPMKSEHTTIYGSSGALPIWTHTAAAIAETSEYQRHIQPADLAFEPAASILSEYGNFISIPVSPISGLPGENIDLPAENRMDQVLADAERSNSSLELKRVFEPLKGESNE